MSYFPDLIIFEEKDLGYCLQYKTKYRVKFWCWAYQNEDITTYVKDKLIDRWIQCPVQKYQDYASPFVEAIDQIEFTQKTIDQLSASWVDTDSIKVDIRKEGG